uniref:Uncharacterized protein n=1 Tax=Siphoviridae sp. ctaaA4 TaxID=2826388 RepID=A0A8S5N4Z4_9CAUD|nr:MAG TPA: hypothetical protein [Siphoviridae sp. ctaaA4]
MYARRVESNLSYCLGLQTIWRKSLLLTIREGEPKYIPIPRQVPNTLSPSSLVRERCGGEGGESSLDTLKHQSELWCLRKPVLKLNRHCLITCGGLVRGGEGHPPILREGPIIQIPPVGRYPVYLSKTKCRDEEPTPAGVVKRPNLIHLRGDMPTTVRANQGGDRFFLRGRGGDRWVIHGLTLLLFLLLSLCLRFRSRLLALSGGGLLRRSSGLLRRSSGLLCRSSGLLLAINQNRPDLLRGSLSQLNVVVQTVDVNFVYLHGGYS